MSILRFQIVHANGRQEVITVEAERALIGSGAHCEIRLPVDQAAVEHVLVQVGAAGVFVQALQFQPPPTIAGVPFTQAPLPPDAMLGVGSSQMLITLTDAVGSTDKKKEKKSNPLVLLVGVVGIAGAALFLFAQPGGGEMEAPEEVPALWGGPLDTCDRPPVEAVPFAQQQKALADNKRERRAFHIRDGVDAVPLYEVAAACFKKGGDIPDSQASAEAAKTLRKEMEDDYRTHRMRMKHSLDVKDNVSAHKEARTLLELLQGKQGPYVDYLTEQERNLKQQLGHSAS